MTNLDQQKGFSLVEALLAGATFALLATAFAGAFLYGQEATVLSGNRLQAVLMAEEGLEAARNLRDSAFSNLTDGTYGLSSTTGSWSLSGSSDTSGSFSRAVTISTVSTNRKQLVSTVSWQQNAQRTGSVSLTTYLTNWLRLGSDWSLPSQESSLDLAGNENGVKISVSGNYAYLVRNGGTPDFAIIDVSTPSAPSLVGSLTLSGTPADVYVSGSYAYVASSDNAQEMQIIDIATPTAPSLVGSYNAPGTTNANRVYVVGTTAYLTRLSSANNELSLVNVTTPSAPTLTGSLNLAADAFEVVVSGSYAYVASGDNSQELKVVDLIVPALPVQVGSLNLSGSTDAIPLSISGSTLFLGQGSTLFTINVTSPLVPVTLGSLAMSGTINDIALHLGGGGSYLYLGTSSTTTEFAVVDVSSAASPSLLGSVNVTGSNPISGIDYSSTLDRAFATNQINTEELQVFKPL